MPNSTQRGAAPPGASVAPSPDLAGVNPTAAPVHYDMDRTIRDALDASADLANALRNVQIDRNRSDEAKAAGRPHVSAEGQATRYDQATKVSIGGGPAIEVLGNHSELLALNATDNLDLTGQIHAAATQAQLQSLEDRLVAQQIANRRILNARTVYYNLLRAQHRVAVAQASLANASAQQKTAVQLNQQQVGQKIDVYRANTQVASAQQQLTAAQNDLGIARQNFNNLVGQPVDTPIIVDDIPGVTVGQSITSASQVGAPAPNIELYSVPQTDLQSIDLPRTIDQAYTRRPEVLAAELEVRVQQTGIKIARSGLEPTLTLAAGGDYYPTTSFQSPRQRTAAVTATLNIPLYDGGATRDRVNEAKLRTQNAETTLSSRKSDVSLDVGQAYLNLITAASQIDAANTALQQAVAARQLAQIRYEGQVGLYLEVTDAEAALVSAENNQVNAVYDYLVAKAQYENALGTPQVPSGATYPAAGH
jgi:outer membrane protein TolC